MIDDLEKWNTSINRNILECKENRRVGNLPSVPVLIETYWNVKKEKRQPVYNPQKY